MLNTLHIQNFRLFQDFQIDNLARVNLIVGKNNVGKSSLLEALFLLVSPNPVVALYTLMENRGEIFPYYAVDQVKPRDYPTTYGDISHLFFERKLDDSSPIEITADNGLNSLTVVYTEDLRQSSLVSEVEDKAFTLPFLRFTKAPSNKEIQASLDGNLLPVDRRHLRSTNGQNRISYVTPRGFDHDSLATLWDGITLTPKEDDVIRMLRVIDSGVERISFVGQRLSHRSGILVKCQGASSPAPLGSMGDGLHRLLTIAATLANCENGFLLIDEIDTGLHYRTITDMWRIVLETAKRLNIQVFATTHSWDCIRSFAEALEQVENPEIGALFRLQKRGETIEPVRYEAERITFALEQEIEVR